MVIATILSSLFALLHCSTNQTSPECCLGVTSRFFFLGGGFHHQRLSTGLTNGNVAHLAQRQQAEMWGRVHSLHIMWPTGGPTHQNE